MTLIIIVTLLFIIRKMWDRLVGCCQNDGLGAVLGEASRYEECPVCAAQNSQNPRGQGEVITRSGHYVVRQYHVCLNCGTRALWHRRLDQWVWTVNRSGVCGIPYRSNG